MLLTSISSFFDNVFKNLYFVRVIKSLGCVAKSSFKPLAHDKLKEAQIYRICHELTVEIKFYQTSLGKCY